MGLSMPYYFHFDVYYLVLVLPALLLALWAQFKVNATYKKFSRVHSSRGYTGQQVARMILDQNGLYHVRVEGISGNLTDHYDPRSNVVRLSQGVYNASSVAAIGIAAHECGHAVQHAEKYAPLQLRSAVIPVTNIGSKLAIPLLLVGVIFNYTPLIWVGILGYSLVALFQLITLPVEFNASSRALRTIEGNYILLDNENKGAKKVLTAAALTYVAALAASLAQLLRLMLLFGGRGSNNRRR